MQKNAQCKILLDSPVHAVDYDDRHRMLTKRALKPFWGTWSVGTIILTERRVCGFQPQIYAKYLCVVLFFSYYDSYVLLLIIFFIIAVPIFHVITDDISHVCCIISIITNRKTFVHNVHY